MGSNTKVDCPDCGLSIEKKNLNKHYNKMHPGEDPFLRMKETRVEKPRRPVTEVTGSKLTGLIIAIFVLATLIVATLFAFSFFQDKGDEKGAPRTIFYSSDDGAVINGTFWPAEESGASTVYLIHDIGEDRTIWNDYALELQDDGYNVLAIDLRGHGESTKNLKTPDITYDWTTMQHDDLIKIQKDIVAANKWVKGTDVHGKDNTDAGVMGAMIGVGRGGLFAFSQVATMSRERMMSAILISPLMDVYQLDVEQEFEDFGDIRPILMAASEGDQVSQNCIERILERKEEDGEANGEGVFVPGTSRGITLLRNDGLKEKIDVTLVEGWNTLPT